jgi:hypothetical protein
MSEKVEEDLHWISGMRSEVVNSNSKTFKRLYHSATLHNVWGAFFGGKKNLLRNRVG